MVDRRTRFEELADEVAEPLHRYAVRRVGPDLAEDVVAEALLVLWRRLDDVPADNPLPWCYGVARGCLRNAERSQRRQRGLVARIRTLDPPRQEDPPELGHAVVSDADVELHEALARLSDNDREVLRLWAWESLTPAEIGVALDVTANAASIRLHRARNRLAEEIGRGGGKIHRLTGQKQATERRAP